ncbi:DUF3267 domain-containing protein [Staphylococcus pseudintermedius]|uniref:metalloprotease family protein n=1 Tax=Staphylococcus pseudintermedius TaxID=283734 RepID=UPI002567F71E|nr:metalloprotease family protein [Staphylococcus pseudintermedius]MDK3952216.1 metalloprotease family protein [Staphylococcus pseudintermedius]MDT0905746.1 metalloprotease family protein [Staphylococcus pseudintermedius]
MYKIDLFQNQQIMKRFLLLQFIVILAFIVLSYKWSMAAISLQEQHFSTNLFIGIIGFLVTVLCHEGIKTILLKMMSVKTRRYQVKNGVLLTFLPQYHFNRMTFSTVMLMPVALVGMLLFIVFINMPYTSIIFTFAIYMGYSLLSFYLVFLALRDKKAQYIEMTEAGLLVSRKKPAERTAH